jgi:ATP-binding cassette subfamily F protein 3
VLDIALGLARDLGGELSQQGGAGDTPPHGGGLWHAPDGQTVARAKQILAGLAFRQTDFDRPARQMSGGWVMRAHLARLLVQEPDLLVLDEPTNHLDLEALLWLQEYLRTYPGAMLLISHDREFLNELCSHVVELRQGRLFKYTGNFDAFIAQRAAQERRSRPRGRRSSGRLTGSSVRGPVPRQEHQSGPGPGKLKQIERLKD